MRCETFQENTSLLTSPYSVRSSVSVGSFRLFLEAIEGEDIAITNDNAIDLQLLCGEFGFRSFLSKVCEFSGRGSFSEVMKRISILD
jgi:hypothetical protein